MSEKKKYTCRIDFNGQDFGLMEVDYDSDDLSGTIVKWFDHSVICKWVKTMDMSNRDETVYETFALCEKGHETECAELFKKYLLESNAKKIEDISKESDIIRRSLENEKKNAPKSKVPKFIKGTATRYVRILLDKDDVFIVNDFYANSDEEFDKGILTDGAIGDGNGCYISISKVEGDFDAFVKEKKSRMLLHKYNEVLKVREKAEKELEQANAILKNIDNLEKESDTAVYLTSVYLTSWVDYDSQKNEFTVKDALLPSDMIGDLDEFTKNFDIRHQLSDVPNRKWFCVCLKSKVEECKKAILEKVRQSVIDEREQDRNKCEKACGEIDKEIEKITEEEQA